MQTPWGKSQSVYALNNHVYWVSTAGHGGVMIAKVTARRELTSSAVKRGMVYGNYLCYEEDCLYALIAFEKPHWFTGTPFLPASIEMVQNKAYLSISAWDADYLLERCIAPAPEEYKYFLFRKEEDAMRKARDPRLIVSACGLLNDVVRVTTADGKEYLVTEYESGRTDRHNLLEYCKLLLAPDELDAVTKVTP